MERRKKNTSLLTSISNPKNRRLNYNNCLNSIGFGNTQPLTFCNPDLARICEERSQTGGFRNTTPGKDPYDHLPLASLSYLFVLGAVPFAMTTSPSPDGLRSKPSRQKMGKEGEAERWPNLPKIIQQAPGKADTGTSLGKPCSSLWSCCQGNGLPGPA